MRKVFLLDTGVNLDRLNSKSIVNTYCINNGMVVKDDSSNDKLGHGTAIANTLLKNTNIDLNVIKIFDEDYICNVERLLAGLEYINEFEDVFLVHLSLGVRRYNSKLEEICRKLFDKGVILVAACDNGMVMSYPAAFDFVISVAPSYRCVSTNQFVFIENSPINLKAKAGGQQIFTSDGERKLIQTGASFAAAHVSSKILSWDETLDKDTILKRFEELAVYKYKFDKIEERDNLFNVERAVIFPFNKENHSLVRFDGLLSFKIQDVFDIKFSSQVGKTIESFYGNKYVIKDIRECNWESFDTFILGHVDELSVIYNRDLKSEIVKLCKEYKKNLYVYDEFNLKKETFEQFDDLKNIYYPKNQIQNTSNKFGWYYQHSTPIIAVLGTSKKQGKFTLQLQLRKIFMEKGINVGQLGTEPTSLLFGMDDMFTFGYFANNLENINAMTECLNQKVHNIDVNGYDIIVTGSQSAFLPYNSYNSNTVNFLQFAFLYSVMPDGVILAINIFDDFDYIKRTIDVIWNMTKSKVFALAIYPFDITYDRIIDSQKKKLTKIELDEIIAKLENYFKLPTIVIGESVYEKKLYREICNFFK